MILPDLTNTGKSSEWTIYGCFRFSIIVPVITHPEPFTCGKIDLANGFVTGNRGNQYFIPKKIFILEIIFIDFHPVDS